MKAARLHGKCIAEILVGDRRMESMQAFLEWGSFYGLIDPVIEKGTEEVQFWQREQLRQLMVEHISVFLRVLGR